MCNYTAEVLDAYIAEVEAEYNALPKLTEEQIEALSDEECAAQGAIEMRYAAIRFAQRGMLEHSIPAIVVKRKDEFPAHAVASAREELAVLEAIAKRSN